MSRGRLIQRFLVRIARLDAQATAAVVDGGLDPDFHEPINVPDGTQLGANSRRYHAVDTLHCQLDRKTWGDRRTERSGEEIDADILIILHWPELENGGFINTSGEPVFQRGDKVVELLTLKGQRVQLFDDPPGMFIEALERAGHGLAAMSTPKTNLLYLHCAYDKKAQVPA
jgi:hypothetical protein